MRKLIILLCLPFFSYIALGEDKVSIAYFEAQPHVLFNSSTREISGALYIFLNKYIAPEMGIEFKWEKSPSNFPRLLYLLSHESVDSLALLIYKKERAKKFSFTKNAYYSSQPAIGVLTNNNIKKVEKVEDILSLKIGYAQKTYISPFMRDKRIKFDLISVSNANRSNILRLHAGRIDAIYIPDEAALLYMVNTMKMKNEIKILELPENPVKLHVVFSKNKKLLARKFDKAFEKIDGEKVYRKILSKYLNNIR